LLINAAQRSRRIKPLRQAFVPRGAEKREPPALASVLPSRKLNRELDQYFVSFFGCSLCRRFLQAKHLLCLLVGADGNRFQPE